MFCFKCGSQQADDAKFCGVCGTGLATVIDPRAVSPEAPASAPPKLHSPALPEAPVADARLGVEDWSVTCTAPDSDGDVRFEAKVRGEYQGTASAHVARLLWVAFGPSGSIPLLQGDNTLTQDIDDEDGVEIEAGGYGKLGEGVDPAACQVQGQVVLYPGEKQAPWTIPLPEAGQAGGKGPAWSNAGAEIAGWRLTCSESSDESASYTLFILARNIGRTPLAAVTFRVRVKNRKGDVWSTEHLTTERLAPGEMRNVETTLYVSERAKGRKGAVIEVVAIASHQEVVCPLAPVAPTMRFPDAGTEEADDGADGPDDTGGEMIDKVQMMSGVFQQKRHRYSSPSAFVAVYCPTGLQYDREAIGEHVFPDCSWGCIDPPGPNAGFGDSGEIGSDLLEKRRIQLSFLKNRPGPGLETIQAVLKAYMDGFFAVDDQKKLLVEVSVEAFMDRVENGDDRDTVELVEFEPD